MCLQLGVCSRTAEELAQAQQQLGAAAEQASATQAQCTRLQGDLDAARLATLPLPILHLLAACKPYARVPTVYARSAVSGPALLLAADSSAQCYLPSTLEAS